MTVTPESHAHRDLNPSLRPAEGRGVASPQAAHGAPAPAVVAGLCAHGLAVSRALAANGVDVIAVEGNLALPGSRTAKATLRNLTPMNGPGLSQTLVRLAQQSAWKTRPVLFLMNDNMVRDVAENWTSLAPHYQLSWAPCRDTVVRLLSKDNLPEICARTGVRVPATARYAGPEDRAAVLEQVPFPAIVKPAWPMGSFKAIIINSAAELDALAKKHERSLPFVVQQWIPGGPTALCFANVFLERGRVLARFEGRKAYAGPDGMGQGTVMEPWPDEHVFQTAMKFLDGLELSGPVAVEFKRDANGELWLIEPNVGRTEYCLAVCTANGVNFPFVEYRAALGMTVPETRQSNVSIWFDTDRDPVSWLRYLKQRGLDARALRPTFPYLRLNDLKPFFAAVGKRLRRFVKRG